MNEFCQMVLNIAKVAGTVAECIIAITLLAMGIFGGSINVKINGIDKFFK